MKITKESVSKPHSDQQQIGHSRKGVQYSCGIDITLFWTRRQVYICENKIKSVKISQNFNFVRLKPLSDL